MPCSTWGGGKKCEICSGYATHYYKNRLICCDCHGGYLCSQKDAKREHEHIILKRDDGDHKRIRKNEVDFSDEIEIF
jgi:hypothetical protein